MKLWRVLLLLGFLVVLVAFASLHSQSKRPEVPDSLLTTLDGHKEDSKVSRVAGGLVLVGGGPDTAIPFIRTIFPSIYGGNALILREYGGAGYNDFFRIIMGDNRLSSVETLVVSSPEAANSEYVSWCIRHAELIWMAGGNQAENLSKWRGSRLAADINTKWREGVWLGGTSAGLSILGAAVCSPPLGYRGSTSEEALANPYNERLEIRPGIFEIDVIDKWILEPHVIARSREGRALAVLARQCVESQSSGWRLLALDESVSVTVRPNGDCEVAGEEDAVLGYIIHFDQDTEVKTVEPGKPLHVLNARAITIKSGDRFSLLAGSSGGEFWSAHDGTLRRETDQGKHAAPIED